MSDTTRDPPNILLIYTDDQPQEWVGCYGGDVLTPNIDRLAAEGRQFTRYYASSPVCSPSRYSALSGRYASRSNRLQRDWPPGGPINIGWQPGIRGEDHTLPATLSNNGYVTGHVGKWHLGMDADVTEIDPEADGRDPDVAASIRENYRTYVSEVEACGFDDVRSLYPRNVFGFELPETMEYHNMDWVTQGALNFLNEHHDERFFLYCAPTLPHDPWEWDQLQADPRITPSGYLDSPPAVQPSRESVIDRVQSSDTATSDPGPAEHAGFMTRENVMVGRAFVSWLDDGIGAILDRLEALGIADDTLVIFTSDHGNRGKFTCYDGGARQPCIARWPGVIEPGTTSDALVSNIDLPPTLFDVASIDPPTDYHFDGRSFSPVLDGSGSYSRESLYLEITTERAVVTDDGLKYIAVRYPPEIQAAVDNGERYSHHCVELGPDEPARYAADEDFPAYFDQDQLYDLTDDPLEQTNLVNEPAYQDDLARLQDHLREYCRELPHQFGEFTD